MVIWIKLGLALLVFILSVLKDWPGEYLKVPQQWAKWVRYLVPVGLALVLFFQSIVGIFEDKPLTQVKFEQSQKAQTNAIVAALGRLKPAVDTVHVLLEEFPSISYSDLYVTTMKSVTDAFFNREYRAAITMAVHLVNTLPESPSLAVTHHIMSLSYAELGRLDSAVIAGASAVKSDSSVAKLWANVGSFEVENGAFERALPYLDRALALDSTLKTALYNRAYALNQTARHSEALASADAVISLDSSHAGAWVWKHVSHGWLGNDSLALMSADDALAHVDRSAYPTFLTLRALSLVKLRDWKGAVASVDSALSYDSTYANGWAVWGQIMLMGWGDTTLARDCADVAFRFDSTNALAKEIEKMIAAYFRD